MEKIQLKNINLNSVKQLSKSEGSVVYDLNNGNVLKLFTNLSLYFYDMANIDIEGKIMCSKELSTVPELVVPKQGVYDEYNFCGYTMPKVNGINLNDYDDNLTLKQRCDLNIYAALFNQLEDIVKRGHKEKIIFPDFCTCDNIIINNGKFKFIDYDGLQVGNHRAIVRSTSLNNKIQYENIPKYCKNGLYTEELDKKSLVILYFLFAFNVDLNMIGARGTRGNIITFDDVFTFLNVNDYDFMHKVWKCLHNTEKGEYIGKDIQRLAYEYEMQLIPTPMKNAFFKRLSRKKKM